MKIPVFQPFGYLTASDSGPFGGLGRFPYPEHQRWGWNLHGYTAGIIPVRRVPVQLSPGTFVDPRTSFEECGGFA